jgi:hypothetical protein
VRKEFVSKDRQKPISLVAEKGTKSSPKYRGVDSDDFEREAYGGALQK